MYQLWPREFVFLVFYACCWIPLQPPDQHTFAGYCSSPCTNALCLSFCALQNHEIAEYAKYAHCSCFFVTIMLFCALCDVGEHSS